VKNKIKIKILYILLLFASIMFFMAQKLYAAPDNEEELDVKIPITAEISGDFSESNCVFKYKIEAYDTNPTGATNEPTDLQISMSSSDRISSNKFSKTEYIDFSSVNYKKTGSYLYKITEISSSYPGKYYISNKTYRIEVIVRIEGGQYKPFVLGRVSDLDKGTKEDKVIFPHTEMTFFKLTMSATGRVADPRRVFQINSYIKW